MRVENGGGRLYYIGRAGSRLRATDRRSRLLNAAAYARRRRCHTPTTNATTMTPHTPTNATNDGPRRRERNTGVVTFFPP